MAPSRSMPLCNEVPRRCQEFCVSFLLPTRGGCLRTTVWLCYNSHPTAITQESGAIKIPRLQNRSFEMGEDKVPIAVRVHLPDAYNKIGGIGTVPVGHLEGGGIEPGTVLCFASTVLTTTVKYVEMFNEPKWEANPRDIVGFCVTLKVVPTKQMGREAVAMVASGDPPHGGNGGNGGSTSG